MTPFGILRALARRISCKKRSFGFHPQDDNLLYNGILPTCHCDERSEEAIQEKDTSGSALNMTNKRQKAAFTLAEVLITLGIIGIVAAMTLPTVINNTRHKELETAFKKSYANLANAVNLVNADGIPVYVLNPTEARPDGDPDANSDFAVAVYSKYKQLKKLTYEQKNEYKNAILNYTRKRPGQVPQCSQAMAGTNSFATMDGSMLSIMQNCGALWFTIDTNGLKKPNALGHDIFIFRIDKNSTALKPAYSESELKLDENGNTVRTEDGSPVYNNTEENKEKCSPTAASAINGSTCANFAILDRCPGDESKGYFECLP